VEATFGLSIPHFGSELTAGGLRDVVLAAEELGYGSVWVGDHVVAPEHFRQRIGPLFYDAFVVLSQAAALTSRVRLGTSVLVLPYRSPLVVAKMAATLDVLSGGRLILGVGAGNAPDEFAALGVDSRTRGRRTDEYLEAMVALWTQVPASYEGEFVSFEGVYSEPTPLQKPYPPIWVGGHSEAALRRAVRFGEAWHSGGMSIERMAEAVRRLRELSEQAGRASPPLVTTRLSVRGPAEEAREAVGRYEELGVSTFVIDLGVPAGPGFRERAAVLAGVLW
jgi:probable F420-dependent oxidoreductase